MINLAALLQTSDEELERQHPGLLAVFQRETECDIRNIQRRIERALCGRAVRIDEEGQAELGALIQRVKQEYMALVGSTPSVLIQFFLAAEKNRMKGLVRLAVF